MGHVFFLLFLVLLVIVIVVVVRRSFFFLYGSTSQKLKTRTPRTPKLIHELSLSCQLIYSGAQKASPFNVIMIRHDQSGHNRE